MFFARHLGLGVLLSRWVHVLTRASTGSNPATWTPMSARTPMSAQEAQQIHVGGGVAGFN